MPVLEIGGLFFRAHDPDALSAWYREHLGVGTGCDVSGQGDPEGNAVELWEPPA